MSTLLQEIDLFARREAQLAEDELKALRRSDALQPAVDDGDALDTVATGATGDRKTLDVESVEVVSPIAGIDALTGDGKREALHKSLLAGPCP